MCVSTVRVLVSGRIPHTASRRWARETSLPTLLKRKIASSYSLSVSAMRSPLRSTVRERRSKTKGGASRRSCAALLPMARRATAWMRARSSTSRIGLAM